MKNIAFVIEDEEHVRYSALPRGITHMDLWLAGLKAKEEELDKAFAEELGPMPAPATKPPVA